MSPREVEEFIAEMNALRAINTASPELARQFLIDEGYLTKDGNVSEPYASSLP